MAEGGAADGLARPAQRDDPVPFGFDGDLIVLADAAAGLFQTADAFKNLGLALFAPWLAEPLGQFVETGFEATAEALGDGVVLGFTPR